MADHEKHGLLDHVDDHYDEDPLQHEVNRNESDDISHEPAATSSDTVELNEIGDTASPENPTKKKKKKKIVKKKKKVKKATLPDGVDQAPVHPDDAAVEGGDQEGYQTYVTLRTMSHLNTNR